MREFTDRGRGERSGPRVTRRELGRLAAFLAAGAALPACTEPALAYQDLKALGNFPPDAVRLNTNENPMGPCPAALAAIRDVLPQGGRYPFRQTAAFMEAMAETEGLPATHIVPGAGSSDLLHRCVMAFTSPARPLVVADPGFEAPDRAARFVGAKVIPVPLRKDYAHDTRAMGRAHPNAGLIYVCNPNNPTGTVTPKADIVALVADKPAGCVVLVDEAYIHFSATAATAVDLVLAGEDVIVLRTFSKLYGMAGIRAGVALGRPDLLEKVRGYGGLSILPAAALVGATASLRNKALVPERRRLLAEVREDLFGWLTKRGYAFIPSDVNMVMIDGKRPGRQTADAMLKHKVAIGRSWPALPTHVRVTIGTREEMAKFKAAFEQVMES